MFTFVKKVQSINSIVQQQGRPLAHGGKILPLLSSAACTAICAADNKSKCETLNLNSAAHGGEVSFVALLWQHRHRGIRDVGGQILCLCRSVRLLLFPAESHPHRDACIVFPTKLVAMSSASAAACASLC